MKTKPCTACKEILPIGDFAIRKVKGKIGPHYRCRQCETIVRKKYSNINKQDNLNKFYDYSLKKTCCVCAKEFTLKNFVKNTQSKGGFTGRCKPCDAAYRQRPADKKRNDANRLRYKNAPIIYVLHKKCTFCKNVLHRDLFTKQISNKDGLDSRCRKCLKATRRPNKEKQSLWKKNNKDKVNISTQKRIARKKNLPHTLTLEEWQTKVDYFDGCCVYCGRDDKPLTQEHIIPVSRGGGYTAENIVPSCQSCNSTKNIKSLEEFVTDKTTLNKILKSLEI